MNCDVMQLSEIPKSDVIWLEFRDGQLERVRCADWDDWGETGFAFDSTKRNDPFGAWHEYPENYNITWRVWRKRPTKKDRKERSWNTKPKCWKEIWTTEELLAAEF